MPEYINMQRVIFAEDGSVTLGDHENVTVATHVAMMGRGETVTDTIPWGDGQSIGTVGISDCYATIEINQKGAMISHFACTGAQDKRADDFCKGEKAIRSALISGSNHPGTAWFQGCEAVAIVLRNNRTYSIYVFKSGKADATVEEPKKPVRVDPHPEVETGSLNRLDIAELEKNKELRKKAQAAKARLKKTA